MMLHHFEVAASHAPNLRYMRKFPLTSMFVEPLDTKSNNLGKACFSGASTMGSATYAMVACDLVRRRTGTSDTMRDAALQLAPSSDVPISCWISIVAACFRR
jgi:hypothetical protein